MEVIKTSIEGLIEIVPPVFGDERGYFFESYNQEKFDKILPGVRFLQDNQSFSTKGVLRGLHFQKPPHAQGKLVRVVTGKVLDVAVDLRADSPTYGHHETFMLDAKKHNMVYVPEGFAHGFVTLEDAVFTYKCTKLYNKASEGGIIWDDPDLNIDWQCEDPVVSAKDLELPRFKSHSRSTFP